MKRIPGIQAVRQWFRSRGWKPFDFQESVWRAVLEGNNGLLNAPTGSGRTYALWFAAMLRHMSEQTGEGKKRGLRVLWITPLRAPATDIERAMKEATGALGIGWTVEVRTGDTSASVQRRQRSHMPDALITTPESLHILFSNPGYRTTFDALQLIVVDEWHELLGTKRGVQTELALARIGRIAPGALVWGISATIGNLDEAGSVLLAAQERPSVVVCSRVKKNIDVQTLLPERVDRFPRAGRPGLMLLPDVAAVIESRRSTLVFTNTRGLAERWYQELLAFRPGLAGAVALHHGSLDRSVCTGVEQALRDERLKAVICTSDLDLGVDFSPVESVVQIGSPGAVGQFLQRAGRSGHHGAVSTMYIAPTHSLELLEAAALRRAVAAMAVEDRTAVHTALDVVVQYCITLACSDGFTADELYSEIVSTAAFSALSRREFEWVLDFITTGGQALHACGEHRKVQLHNGWYHIADPATALRHRLQIGTIVPEAALAVQYLKGGKLGTIEERFITHLKPGDVFRFAGKSLELVAIRNRVVYVQRSAATEGIIPSWTEERPALSPLLCDTIRRIIAEAAGGTMEGPEMEVLRPLFAVQQRWSAVPAGNELLVEYITTREGHHLFLYPFEGRTVHEGLAALLALRIGRIQPAAFSIATNDYGIELLTAGDISPERILQHDVFSDYNLREDILESVDAAELAKRRFREIARVAGLVSAGFAQGGKEERHLRASSDLVFDVVARCDPNNLLLKQAYEEVLAQQLNEKLLRAALGRLSDLEPVIARPRRLTPFAFPLTVGRLYERTGGDDLREKIMSMQLRLERAADSQQ